jgi:nucleoid-associated protein YgaU
MVAGDTLAAVAFREYGDATLWRAIADANLIDDPLRVRPGTELLIPPAVEAAAAR